MSPERQPPTGRPADEPGKNPTVDSRRPSLHHATARALGTLSVVIFAALVIDVLWGVATRYVFGHQAFWSEELARFLLVWLSMLGAALAYAERSHLGVDTLLITLDPQARRIAVLAGHVLVLLFGAVVMVYGGALLFVERWQSGQVLSSMPILKAWMYLSVPVSGTLITLFALHEVVTHLESRSDAVASPGGTATLS